MEKYGRFEKCFTKDETKSTWERAENIELLKQFCKEGYPMAKKYGHFIIGNAKEKSFIGIPGRFMIKEQPGGGKTGFTLWQPLCGGEEMYGDLSEMNDEIAEQVYGYWIAAVDSKTLKISEC